VIALSAAERFVEFFLRSDSDKVALGLEVAQWTSLGLLAVAGLGAWLTFGRGAGERGPGARARLDRGTRAG
jgi:hypothetical protein